MTDRPIIFSGPMVRAILDGRKTQTRRVLKPQPLPNVQIFRVGTKWDWRNGVRGGAVKVPYQIGDRLWVREAWQAHSWASDCVTIRYRAEERTKGFTDQIEQISYPSGDKSAFGFVAPRGPHHWRPSIHMPRWASRLTLTVTDVRVQRVQDISEADAIAEGIETGIWKDVADCVDWPLGPDSYPPDRTIYHAPGSDDAPCYMVAIDAFAQLWDSINAKRGHGWDANPWVVALTFTAEQRNIDEVA